MASSNNPFRNRKLSPEVTGTSVVSDIAGVSPSSSSSGGPPPGDPGDVHPPSPSPRSRSNSTSNSNSADGSSSSSSHSHPPLPPDDIINEELPPAYTAAPDISHGETTIELGPRRPFQQAPRLPPQLPQQQPLQQQQQRWPYLVPTPTGWEYSGRLGRPGLGVGPPPRHPTQWRPGHTRPLSAPNNDAQPMSDFARDFYAAGAGAPGAGAGEAMTASSSNPNLPSSSSPTADDGKPTETPTPGHPLLRHGRVLVYPSGYECSKCKLHNLYCTPHTELTEVF